LATSDRSGAAAGARDGHRGKSFSIYGECHRVDERREPRYRKLRSAPSTFERGDISRSILDAGPEIDPDHLNENFKAAVH